MTAERVGRAARARRAERPRPLHELQHPLLPDGAGGPARVASGGELGRGLERPRRLPPGLAAAPDRLELAARAGEGRRAARGRRHRLALAGPRPVRDRAARSRRSSPTWRRRSPSRQRPIGEVETFAAAADVERVDTPMSTEDFAHILVRFDGGARGSAVVSQVSAGRKNSLRFEVDGSRGSLAWDARAPRGALARAPRRAERAPAAQPRAPRRPEAPRLDARCPPAHAEGFADTFRELYRAVYADVARGGPPDDPDYPTFRDGHVENVLGDAIARSNRERAMGGGDACEARTADGGLPRPLLEQVAAWAAARRLRDARGRLLAGRRRRAAPLRRRHAHRRGRLRPRRRARRSSSGTASRSRRSRTTRTTSTPTTPQREEANAHLRKVIDAAARARRPHRRHLRRQRQGPAAAREPRSASARSGRRSSSTRASAASASRSRTAR